MNRSYFLFNLVFFAGLAASFFLTFPRPAPLNLPQTAAVTTSESPPPSRLLEPRLINSGFALDLSAYAFLSALVRPAPAGRSGESQIDILVEKNAREARPLASLTKLVTAMVAVDRYNLADTIVLTKEYLPQPTDPAFLRPGDAFRLGDLLYPMLIESSNNAASALAAVAGEGAFVRLMNEKALALGLTQTRFINPSGLDPAAGQPFNTASAYDLLLAAAAFLGDYPQLVKITGLESWSLYTLNGDFHHEVKQTNRLLEINSWPVSFIGGKTGQTDLARRNLLLILQDRESGAYLVSIILGANDHFADMRQLVDWIYLSYDWD